MTEYCLAYIPCSNIDEAKSLGKIAVEKKLAACANILPIMASVYEWEGKIEEGTESLLLLKTRSNLFESLKALIEDKHSYDCTCVLSLDVADVNQAYGKWLKNQLT